MFQRKHRRNIVVLYNYFPRFANQTGIIVQISRYACPSVQFVTLPQPEYYSRPKPKINTLQSSPDIARLGPAGESDPQAADGRRVL